MTPAHKIIPDRRLSMSNTEFSTAVSALSDINISWAILVALPSVQTKNIMSIIYHTRVRIHVDKSITRHHIIGHVHTHVPFYPHNLYITNKYDYVRTTDKILSPILKFLNNTSNTSNIHNYIFISSIDIPSIITIYID